MASVPFSARTLTICPSLPSWSACARRCRSTAPAVSCNTTHSPRATSGADTALFCDSSSPLWSGLVVTRPRGGSVVTRSSPDEPPGDRRAIGTSRFSTMAGVKETPLPTGVDATQPCRYARIAKLTGIARTNSPATSTSSQTVIRSLRLPCIGSARAFKTIGPTGKTNSSGMPIVSM